MAERQWEDAASLLTSNTTNTAREAAAVARHRRDAEVFFFDGSKEVHSQDASVLDWEDDTSTQTASYSSSEDSTVLLELADLLKPAQLGAWEDVGTTNGSLHAVEERGSAGALLQTDPTVAPADGTLEVYEGDAVEVGVQLPPWA